MARSVNRVTLLGHIGRDAETKHSGNGTPITKFSIATNRRVKKGDQWEEMTDWHNVIAWDQEKVAAYLLKGKQVYVEGRLQTRSYDKDGEKRYSTEVIAENIILLSGDKSDSRQPVSMPRSAKPAEMPHAYAPPDGAGFGPGSISDDDVPFMRYDVPCL
jgi:single-strand DNA-binding protein